MRTVFVGLFILATVISFAADEREAARAWHRQSWTTWSGKTGLSVETIEKFWQIAMGPDGDEYFGQGIETIDAQSLKSRRQILFVVSAGNGHCLDIFVFESNREKKKPVWELSYLPNGSGGICHEQMLPYPTACAGPQGDIVIQVPTEPAWISREKPESVYPVSTALNVYTYRWNGTTYELAKAQKVITYHSQTLNAEKCTSGAPCVQ